MTEAIFDRISEPCNRRLAVGLAKIGLAMRSQAWKESGSSKLTPTQASILALLRGRGNEGARLSAVADALGVSRPTASDAVATLVRKALVEKGQAGDDGRALALRLTPSGQSAADRMREWPDFLEVAIDALTPSEQEVMLRAVIKMIRTLQLQGEIPVARMCVNCRFFRPNVYDDPAMPHHCAFVDAPFGDRHLRIGCGEFALAGPELRERNWSQFTNPKTTYQQEENRP